MTPSIPRGTFIFWWIFGRDRKLCLPRIRRRRWSVAKRGFDISDRHISFSLPETLFLSTCRYCRYLIFNFTKGYLGIMMSVSRITYSAVCWFISVQPWKTGRLSLTRVCCLHPIQTSPRGIQRYIPFYEMSGQLFLCNQLFPSLNTMTEARLAHPQNHCQALKALVSFKDRNYWHGL